MEQEISTSVPLFDRMMRQVLLRERWLTLLLLVVLIVAAWRYLVSTPPFMVGMGKNHAPLPAIQPWTVLFDVFSSLTQDTISQAIPHKYNYAWYSYQHFLQFHFFMWLAMIAGMMLPTAVPTILAYLNITESGRARQLSQQPAGSSFLFIVGYLFVWTIAAIAGAYLQGFFLGYASYTHLTPALANRHVILSAGVLFLAGLYQFSTWKDACLRECQSPMRFFLAHWREGYWGAFNMGLRHGSMSWVLLGTHGGDVCRWGDEPGVDGSPRHIDVGGEGLEIWPAGQKSQRSGIHRMGSRCPTVSFQLAIPLPYIFRSTT